MNFGENLKKLRKLKKLSQESLAEKMNVSRQSVSKWETGDAYPEMNNLLELCKIFKCKISDLVNDSIIDIDELDDDIKEEIENLKKEERSKMKKISKVICCLSNIGRIICNISIPIIIISMIIVLTLMKNLKVEDNKIIWDNPKINIEFITAEGRVKVKVDDVVVEEKYNLENKYIDILENTSRPLLIGYIVTGTLVLVIYLYAISRTFYHINALFKNIDNGDTPFTLENVEHIKKLAYTMIAIVILSNIANGIFYLILTSEFTTGIEMFDLLEILFLFSMSYIFEYGRLVQLESK